MHACWVTPAEPCNAQFTHFPQAACSRSAHRHTHHQFSHHGMYIYCAINYKLRFKNNYWEKCNEFQPSIPITHYYLVFGGPLHPLELTVYMHELTSQLQSSEWVKRPAPFAWTGYAVGNTGQSILNAGWMQYFCIKIATDSSALATTHIWFCCCCRHGNEFQYLSNYSHMILLLLSTWQRIPVPLCPDMNPYESRL